METFGKHLIFKLLNNEPLELSINDLQAFSLEFQKQYNLINRMKTQGVKPSIIDLELYDLAFNGKETIDKDYALESNSFDGKNLQDLIKIKVQQAKHSAEVDRLNNLLDLYKQGDKQAALEMQKVLSNNISNKSDAKVVSINNEYIGQVDFFNSVVNKEELEGLILYGNNKKNSTQFIGLSNILKRIALTDLVIIGARPSVGKTSFALALMNALYKNDYKPLFISLEMTNGELLQRLATAKSGLSHDLIMSPNHEFTPEEVAGYRTALHKSANMDIKVIQSPPTSWLEMKQLIIDNIKNIDYVVVDHLHIISTYDGTPNNNKNQMYGEITRDMKMLARDYKIPIIVLAQLSREVRSGAGGKGSKRVDPSYVEPYMTDLRDSGSIEQDADKILMLYRELPKGTGDMVQEKIKGHAQYGNFPIICKIEKHRAGKLGSVRYLFNAKTGRWNETREEKKNDT